MTDLSLQEKFESISRISTMLEDYRLYYCSYKVGYTYSGVNSKRAEAVLFINGAWWLFKEMNK